MGGSSSIERLVWADGDCLIACTGALLVVLVVVGNVCKRNTLSSSTLAFEEASKGGGWLNESTLEV